MAKGYAIYWRKLAAVERVFLLVLVLYIVLYFSGITPTLRSVIGLVKTHGASPRRSGPSRHRQRWTSNR